MLARTSLFGRITTTVMLDILVLSTTLPGALRLCLRRNGRRDIELVDIKNWRHTNPGLASLRVQDRCSAAAALD